MNKNVIAVVGASVVSLGIGFGVGHIWTKNRVTKFYENLIDTQLEEIKQDYINLKRSENFVSPEEAVATLINPDAVIEDEATDEAKLAVTKLLEDNQYTVAPQITENNIFVNGIPINKDEHNTDYEVIVNPDAPYVISVLLYHDHNQEFDKVTLFYYQGDDTIADEDDQLLDGVDRIIGNINLTKFGEGSNDEDIVYIRNEKITTDMEIIRRKGTYTEMVLGVPPLPDATFQTRMRENDE